ncbi:MAG: CPBP family intramembrane metalloprotease [Polyangiaceae bacterium]|nr:CPBP family intramembrane metalloprotease [Polyangiaceae bacterium]
MGRRFAAVTVWLALFLGLVPLGNAVVPDATKATVSLQTFLMTCQIATLVVGLSASLLLLKERRRGLGLHQTPTVYSLLSATFAVPLVFAASSAIAIRIALPVLLEELKTKGANASAQNAGAFGKALTQSPLFITLIWGALLGALGEELFFRGLFWSTITDLTSRILSRINSRQTDNPPNSLSPTQTATSPEQSASFKDHLLRIVFDGGIATLLSAALFGWMHKDLPGGVGIVRFWSTTCLGFASGVVRQSTGSVLPCILLHALYNTLVIGTGHKWFFDPKEKQVLEPVPNTLLLLAVIGVALIGVLWFVRVLAARRARSMFSL